MPLVGPVKGVWFGFLDGNCQRAPLPVKVNNAIIQPAPIFFMMWLGLI